MGMIAQRVFIFSRWLKQWLQALQRPDDKLFIDNEGTIDEFFSGMEKRKHVRFPVRLAIRYGEEMPLMFDSFVLNASKGGVFILSDQPLPKGSMIQLHFFIPPEEKLLGTFEGEVVDVNSASHNPHGMHVKFFGYSDEGMELLEAFLEERHQLVDMTA